MQYHVDGCFLFLNVHLKSKVMYWMQTTIQLAALQKLAAFPMEAMP